jgi:hypothetical protein
MALAKNSEHLLLMVTCLASLAGQWIKNGCKYADLRATHLDTPSLVLYKILPTQSRIILIYQPVATSMAYDEANEFDIIH